MVTRRHHCTDTVVTRRHHCSTTHPGDTTVRLHIPGDTLLGYHSGAYVLEVIAVSGIMVIAVLKSLMKINAETSRFDLADLSKMRPRWKYWILSRARVNFRVTLSFYLIVGFLINDRLNHAFLEGNPVLVNKSVLVDKSPFW